MKDIFFALLWLFPGWLSAQNTININFAPVMNGQPLRTGAYIYRSANGDSLQVDVLRFYVCNLQLVGQNGQVYTEKDSYHLIDIEDSASLVVHLKDVPKGKYAAVRFDIGTDSLTNVSGAMGGDLDPTKGMYWAWNSGFINVKIEGKSAACNTRHHVFEFHVGGYMPPNTTVRQVVLPLKKKKGAKNITVNVDVMHFFNTIHLATTHQMMIPGKQAAALADIFQHVFEIKN
jgi:hypothetical protein